jgi:hypothetical protein
MDEQRPTPLVDDLEGTRHKLVGWFSDRIPDAKYSASAGFCIMAIGIVLLYNAQTAFVLYAYALI